MFVFFPLTEMSYILSKEEQFSVKAVTNNMLNNEKFLAVWFFTK